MFDRIVAVVPQGRQTHNHHITVNVPEPTPEKAAALLDGLRKEAADQVKNAVLIDVPGIDCKAVRYELHRNGYDLTIKHRVAFTINGTAYDLEMTQPDDLRRDEIAEKVSLALARAILGQTTRMEPLAWRSLLRA